MYDLLYRNPALLPYTSAADLNQLEGQFMEYQLMAQAGIPERVWESALIVDGETRHHRMDLIWKRCTGV